MVITCRKDFEPLQTGLAIAEQLHRLYPNDWEAKGYARLLGNKKVLEALLSGQPASDLTSLARDGISEFMRRRQAHLIYE